MPYVAMGELHIESKCKSKTHPERISIWIIGYLPLGNKGPCEKRARGPCRCNYNTKNVNKIKNLKKKYIKQILQNIFKSECVVYMFSY